jgi:cell wall-associated NlpC family hydrolase
MTPPTRHKTFIRPARSFCIAVTLLLGISALPTSANAMVVPDALSSLKGLTPSHRHPATLRDRVVQAGLDAVGTPYSWGGDDPDGFDCSGLVSFVYRKVAGVTLPRRARDQRAVGKKVAASQLLPGDLVFFKTRRRGATSHVGIYVGMNEFVHAPTRGSTVRVDKLNNTYWSKHFAGARRFLTPGSTDVAVLASKQHKTS